MRRIVKPFTVEVRNSTRRQKVERPIFVASVPIEAEQPSVAEWPSIDEAPAASPQTPNTASSDAMAPTGRILPVVDEPDEHAERLAAVPRRGTRRQDAFILAELEPIASLAPASVKIASDPIKSPAAPDDPGEPSADPELEPVDVRAIAATLILRRRLKRLLRSQFRRGEGWRARLPVVVHLGRKRQQKP